MNNAGLFWDRFEAIALVVNENSDMVGYIDKSDRFVFIKEDDWEYSQRYNRYVLNADMIDYEIIYDFFCVAFDKEKLNYALEVGSDEAILDFLKDAYAKAKVSFTDKSLKEVLEAIHDIMGENEQERINTCK